MITATIKLYCNCAPKYVVKLQLRYHNNILYSSPVHSYHWLTLNCLHWKRNVEWTPFSTFCVISYGSLAPLSTYNDINFERNQVCCWYRSQISTYLNVEWSLGCKYALSKLWYMGSCLASNQTRRRPFINCRSSSPTYIWIVGPGIVNWYWKFA